MTTQDTTAEGFFDALQGEQFVVLTTYRASGEAVPTTVWFAEAGGRLFITTNAQLKKVRRIKANPQVMVAASDRVGNVHGQALPASARLLEPAEFERAATALRTKYGLQYVAMTAQFDAQEAGNNRIFIELAPPENQKGKV